MEPRSDTPTSDRCCAECGYDLHMLAAPRCPECGAAFDPNTTRRVRPVRPILGNTAATFSIVFACFNAAHAVAQTFIYADVSANPGCGCGPYFVRGELLAVSILVSSLSAFCWAVSAHARAGVRPARLGFLAGVTVDITCMWLLEYL